MRLSLESFPREPSSLSDAGAASTRRNGLAYSIPPGSENMAKAHEGSLGTWETRPSPPMTSGSGTGITNPRSPRLRVGGRWEQTPAQRWYRQAKATKRGERDGRESERLVVPWRPGNHSEGPGGGKGAPCHETVGGKHGGCIETRGRVHETTTDRRTRSTEPGDGIHVPGLSSSTSTGCTRRTDAPAKTGRWAWTDRMARTMQRT